MKNTAGLPKASAGKDGVSYLPTLLAEAQEKVHDYVIVNNLNKRVGSSALIAGDGWKLIEIDRKKDHFQLYNIKGDNEERRELAAQYPERVAELKNILLRELGSARPDLKAGK